MMGAARSASLRDVAPLNAGTARFFWRGAPMRHPGLALPGNPGALCPALHAAFCELQRRLRQLQREPPCAACKVAP